MDKILNPSCSEIVWRLNIDKSTKQKIMDELEGNDGETNETGTDTFPNDCLNDMIMFLEEAKENGKDINNVEVEYVDSPGGGGNWDFVESCFEIAKAHIKKKITSEEARKLEEDCWNDEIEDLELEINKLMKK